MTQFQDELAKARGRAITTIDLREGERLVVTFEDGSLFTLWDDARYCCEIRSMSCDDDLSHFGGAMLNDAEVRDVGGEEALRDEDEDGDVREVQFLVVTTSLGSFTVANHNHHNGYYGGFDLSARFDERAA